MTLTGEPLALRSTFMSEVVRVAFSQVGVREHGGRHRGPVVDLYIMAGGLDPEKGAYPWCACFVCWVYQHASATFGIPCPLPRHPGALHLFQKCKDAGLVLPGPEPGAIFFHDSGLDPGKPLIYRRGHCGIVVGALGLARLETVEGNTDPAGSRDGQGVYLRSDRTLAYVAGYAGPPCVPAPGE